MTFEAFLNAMDPVKTAREFTEVTVEEKVSGAPRTGFAGETVGVVIEESPLRIVSVKVALPFVYELYVAVSV